MQELKIEIARDSQDLAERMVQLFVAACEEAIASRGVFYTALSGGRTPGVFFQRLVNAPAARALAWSHVHLFWVDERYVPADSQASNYRFVADTLLGGIAIPQANIHRIVTEYASPTDSAAAYEQTIRQVFGLREGEVPQFDLIVLGMGSDGHTASLFPDSRALRCSDRLACAVQAGENVKFDRITLTPQVLLAAKRLGVLVSGAEKSQTLNVVLAGRPDETRYPIHVLWPVLDRVVWLVDRDAAGQIG